MSADPLQRVRLPLGITLGGIDAQAVRPRFDQSRDTLCVIPAVDGRSYQVPFVLVQQLLRVLLVAVIVLAEHEVFQMVLFVDDRQAVQLVIPQDVVRLTERDGIPGVDLLSNGV
jgi:hypothetical protein